MGIDSLGWYQVSAQSGHAGPGSSVPYINALEVPMAAASRLARPKAWTYFPTVQSGEVIFPEIGDGVLGVRGPVPSRMEVANEVTTSFNVDLRKRERIIWGLIDGQKFRAVGSACGVTEDLVNKVLEEVVEVLVQLQLARSELLLSSRKQCFAVSAYLLWARAAQQGKYVDLTKYLQSSSQAGNWKSLQTLWSDWVLCRDGNFLSLLNSRPSVRLATALLDAGMTKRQMVVLSAQDALPLAGAMKTLNLPALACAPRKGRAVHRLFFVSRGAEAVKSNAATLSVVGFHWWMVLLGSLLISRGEI